MREIIKQKKGLVEIVEKHSNTAGRMKQTQSARKTI